MFGEQRLAALGDGIFDQGGNLKLHEFSPSISGGHTGSTGTMK